MTMTWYQSNWSWTSQRSWSSSRSWTSHRSFSSNWPWFCSWSRPNTSPNGLLLLVCLVLSSLPAEGTTNHTILEIGKTGHYKDLICEVSQHCKVSWKKDNETLQLSNGERISCEKNCQTLKFKGLVAEDAGFYTCHAVERCEGENLPQRIHLRVDEDQDSEIVVITQYEDCQDKSVHPGEDVTFCCICKVGQVSESTYVSWYDDNYNLMIENEAPKSDLRYDSETELASCITLHDVNKTFEGNYTLYCSAPLGSDLIELELLVLVESWWWIAVVSVVSVLVTMAILTGIVYRANSVKIRLMCKDQFGKQEKDDEIGEEIVQALKKSRRYIILLSPQFLLKSYVGLETAECLDIIKQQKKNIIPVFIRDIPPDDLKKNTALEHIVSTHPRLDWRIFDESRSKIAPIRTLSMENGNTIEMEGSANVRTAPKLKRADVRVWRTLRLKMPPIPRERPSEDIVEEPLSSIETDSLIRHQVSQEGSTNGENLETVYPSNVII